jgi:hypothetical protein
MAHDPSHTHDQVPAPPTAPHDAAPAGSPISGFLRLLWPRGWPGHLVLWQWPSKACHWVECSDLDPDERLSPALQHRDLYFTVAAHDWELCVAEAKRRGEAPDKICRRGYACSAMAIPGLWWDIDCVEGIHSAKNLPTLAQARDLALTFGPRPSILVFTGGGLHGYHLFPEPLLLRTAADREAAKRLEKSLLDALRRRMDQHGWKLDAVQSLDHVLRLPGSHNQKFDPPRKVHFEVID